MGRHNNERREMDARRPPAARAPSWMDRPLGWKLLVLSMVVLLVAIALGTGPATYWFRSEPEGRGSGGITLPGPEPTGRTGSPEPGVSLTVGPEQSPSTSTSPSSSTPPVINEPGGDDAPSGNRPRPRPSQGTPTRPPAPAIDCRVAYTRTSSWEQGHQVRLELTNRGRATVNGWAVRWSFRGDQVVRQAWNARHSQSGRAVTLRDDGWNGQLDSGETVTVGFEATAADPNTDPVSFSLNGSPCGTGRDGQRADPR